MLQRLSFNTLKQRKVNVGDKSGKGGGELCELHIVE